MNVRRRIRGLFPLFTLLGVILLGHYVATTNGYSLFLELGIILVYATIAYIVLATIDALFFP